MLFAGAAKLVQLKTFFEQLLVLARKMVHCFANRAFELYCIFLRLFSHINRDYYLSVY